MSQTRFIETCDTCGKKFDILTEGQYINQKKPRCFTCQPKLKVRTKFIEGLIK